MGSLSSITEFIQVISEAVADALGIDTSVVDTNLVRIAGTATKQVPYVISSGIIKIVMETGKHYIAHDTGAEAHCTTCGMRDMCKETAFLHCPIMLNGEIVGVMGLMCFDDEQRERLVSKQQEMLNFVQRMCDIISLKLQEHDNRLKTEKLYEKIDNRNIMLDQIINSISDGYIVLDNNNRITNANRSARKILSSNSENPDIHYVDSVLSEFDMEKPSVSANGKYSYYDEIEIGGTSYGVTVNLLLSDNAPIGKIINFKTLDKIGKRAIKKATRSIAINNILGETAQITKIKELAHKAAESDLNVLLIGESGTGKELFARGIHSGSSRKNNPLVAINCSAIPENLFESELFGYEQGAFTGALKDGKPGKIEMAHTGTLFLDEIGDMPLSAQVKLLRVLQDFVIERIGSVKLRSVDVRVIAATNQNLEKMVEDGSFRMDLYYRLNVIPIKIPALRERKEDIPLLTGYFLKKYSLIAGIEEKTLTKEAMEVLMNHPWPGNVRELENLVQYLVFISTNDVIDTSGLPDKLLDSGAEGGAELRERDTRLKTIAEVEKEAILNALRVFGNTTEGKIKAANYLGIGKTTLYRKLAEYSGG